MTWGVNSSMADVTQGKNLSASGKGLNIIHDYYYHRTKLKQRGHNLTTP